MVPPPIARGRTIARHGSRGSIRNSAAAVRTPGGGRPGGHGYGRGSREIVRRSARALTDNPISVSSAAAWTAVRKRSGRGGGGGLAERRAAGVPAGWAGWRSGCLRDGDARRLPVLARRVAAISRGLACALASALAAFGGDACVVAFGGDGCVAAFGGGGCDGAAGGVLGAAPDGGRAARLSLRRCGRVRGSAPRTSEGRSSAIAHMIARLRAVSSSGPPGTPIRP